MHLIGEGGSRVSAGCGNRWNSLVKKKKKGGKNPSKGESFIFHEHVRTGKQKKICHEHYCEDFLAAQQARRIKYFRIQHSSSNSGQIISVVLYKRLKSFP